MRWFKIGLLFGILAFVCFYFFATTLEESKTISAQKELNYPAAKLFPQFNNLQNFVKWNSYFKENKNYYYQFFTPYEGLNSSMTFYNDKREREGDLFLKYVKNNKFIRYSLFTANEVRPYTLEVNFLPQSADKTLIKYTFKTPKIPVLARPFNIITESDFNENLHRSLDNLSIVLSNKVDKEQKISQLKFDSVMVEKSDSEILLGVNVSAGNKNNDLVSNIILNHSKVRNYLLNDLHKEEDEFGAPTLITDPNELKSKTISYFYGFPLSKKVTVNDNNFVYRYLNDTKTLVIYFKGPYKERIKSFQKLMSVAKVQELRTGLLYETFLEPPSSSGECTLRLALQIL